MANIKLKDDLKFMNARQMGDWADIMTEKKVKPIFAVGIDPSKHIEFCTNIQDFNVLKDLLLRFLNSVDIILANKLPDIN